MNDFHENSNKTYWIHQLWWPFTSEASSTPPVKYHENILSWIEKNPHAHHKIWNREDSLQLLQTDYPWFVQKWLDFKQEIQRSDAIRPFILHKYGGVYADMDSVCYQNFQEFMKQAPIIIGNEFGNFIMNFFSTKIILENAILVSRAPLHPFWIHYARSMSNHENILKGTGPLMLTEAYHSFQNKDDIWVIDRKVFYPIPLSICVFPLASKFYSKKEMQSMEFGLKFNKNAMASHQYDGTWKKDQNWRENRTNFILYIILVIIAIILVVLILKRKKKPLNK